MSEVGTDGAVDVATLKPLDEDEIWTLATTEYGRMRDLLRTLRPEELALPTDCAAWTVAAMVSHLVGASEGFSSPRQLLWQYSRGWIYIRRGLTDGTQLVDGANAVQVADRARLPLTDLVARYERVIDPILTWRRRLRRLPGGMDDVGGRFTFRQLFEVILTRDTWMHRVDLSRSTGRVLALTPEHDGRLVADAVRDWAAAPIGPFRLRLTGPAGGFYGSGRGGQPIEMDAVEFMRLLSGRGLAGGLLGARVVF